MRVQGICPWSNCTRRQSTRRTRLRSSGSSTPHTAPRSPTAPRDSSHPRRRRRVASHSRPRVTRRRGHSPPYRHTPSPGALLREPSGTSRPTPFSTRSPPSRSLPRRHVTLCHRFTACHSHTAPAAHRSYHSLARRPPRRCYPAGSRVQGPSCGQSAPLRTCSHCQASRRWHQLRPRPPGGSRWLYIRPNKRW